MTYTIEQLEEMLSNKEKGDFSINVYAPTIARQLIEVMKDNEMLHKLAGLDLSFQYFKENTALKEQNKSLTARLGVAEEALEGLVKSSTDEANEKGAGGYHLARLSDAREALSQIREVQGE